MKSIELKTEIEKLPSGVEMEMKTVELMRVVINATPEGGFTPTEMMFRLKLLNELDKSNGEMKLEDADYEKLSLLVKETRWSVLSRFIIEFVNSFN